MAKKATKLLKKGTKAVRPRAVHKPAAKAKKSAPARAQKTDERSRTVKAQRRKTRAFGDEIAEELAVAREELMRLSSELITAKRGADRASFSASAAEERICGELEATRIELKTALADLEIARNDVGRTDARLHEAARVEAEAREAQRRAEHLSDSIRESARALRQEIERLRAENEQLRAEAMREHPSRKESLPS